MSKFITIKTSASISTHSYVTLLNILILIGNVSVIEHTNIKTIITILLAVQAPYMRHIVRRRDAPVISPQGARKRPCGGSTGAKKSEAAHMGRPRTTEAG